MADPDSPEQRAALEANEVHIWIGEPVVGLWCPTCNLPSAWRAPIGTDLATPDGSYAAGCTECDETDA